MRKRIAILGFLLIIALSSQVVDMSQRTSAQILLADDSPEFYDAPVPDDYEFEVLAANHTVVGIRPSSGDNFDLEVYTNTTFTTMIDSSSAGGSRVDFVFLNGTEWASPPNRTARVISGTTSYVIEMENDVPARTLAYPWNGTMEAFGSVKEVFDAFELIDMTLGKVYTIQLIVPASADLDMFILNATGDRSEAIAFSTNAGPGLNESTSFTANSTDDIVLVITNENNGTGNYTVIPNLPPIVNVSGDQTIFEGQMVNVIGNYSDPDMSDNYTYEWDFGDGNSVSGTLVGSNLLENGDFSDGLTGWNTSVEAPTTILQIIPQDGNHFNVLEIENPVNDGDGDWDWAYQTLDLNVTNYTELYLEVDIKAIYQSLSDDGWAGGEYPVHLALRYMDINGVWHNGIWFNNPWQHGFYYLGTGGYPYSQKVPQNVWVHYKSGNLMEINPKPMIIDKVRVGASGHAYHGMIDNVMLYKFDNNGTVEASNTYGDDGIYNATLTVTDSNGGSGTDTLVVTVNNLSPSGNLSGPHEGLVNQPLAFIGNGTDPGSDDLTFTWDWGDGTSTTVNTHYNDGSAPDPDLSPAGTFPFSIVDSVEHTYSNEGVYTITLTIEDDDGGSVVYQTTVNITSPPITEPPVEYNWKPLIALVFAIVLLLLGIVVSHQKPLRFKGILRRDRQYTFLACSLPFVIAEVITGLVSFFTDLLPVPPWFGFAMILDLTILIAGILVCMVVLAKGKKPETYGEDSTVAPFTQSQESAAFVPPTNSGEVQKAVPGSACTNCGQTLEPGYVVCPNCGKKV
jgi:PKD repeat protein